MNSNSIIFEAINNNTTRKPKTTRKYTFLNRKQKIKTPLTYHNLFSLGVIIKTRKNQCLSKCLDNISNDSILKIRRTYISKNELEKNRWLREYLEYNQINIEDNQITRWHIDGTDVCKNCWLIATTATLHKLKYCFRNSHHSNSIPKKNARLECVIAWLSNYFNSVCEKMPTKEEFHLPCFIVWKDILVDLNQYLETENYTKLTPSYFTRVITFIFVLIYFFRSKNNIFLK
jgi:hypothetical protein